jgi:hypothetical protein
MLQTLEVDVWPDYEYDRTRCDHQALQLLVQCCPGLRDVQLGAAVAKHADLSPLKQLQQLTSLRVCFDLGDKTAQGLAVLAGLRRLRIDTDCLPAVALAWLTKLENLVELGIHADCEPEDGGFRQISEELLKHPEVTQYKLHLETRSVSCHVRCKFEHLLLQIRGSQHSGRRHNAVCSSYL